MMKISNLIRYAKEQLKAGYSEDAIEKVLISEGHSPETAKKIVEKAKSIKELPPPPLPKKEVKKDFEYAIVAVIIVSIIIIGLISIRASTSTPAMKSASTCRFILNESQRDNCYLNLSFGINDTIFCGYITNNAERDRCYYEIQKNVNDCGKISNDFLRGDCYYSFARKLNNETLCSKIEGPETKKRCINYFNK